MKGWFNWPDHEGYWWYRKKNGAPKLVRVYALDEGGIECWYCPGVKRFFQQDIVDGIWWKPVKNWNE